MKQKSFTPSPPTLAWSTLTYLLGVIAWGAYVRASGSGAGCGSHWPLCNGQVIPISTSSKTWIEFTHRLTSGLSLIFCGVLFWSVFRNYSKGSLSRKGAVASLVLILVEALLGAGLVLLELVAENKSLLRTVSLGIHLLSTFILLAAVLLTARWSSQERRSLLQVRPLRKNLGLGILSSLSIFFLLLLGASGAMTALGDTLFPASSLGEGLIQDLSLTSHFLIQLRVFHPVFAVGVTVYLFFFTFYLKKRFEKEPNSEVPRLATLLAFCQFGQLLLGALNIYFLVPTALQLAHLFMADTVWIFLILTLSAVWISPGQKVELTLPKNRF